MDPIMAALDSLEVGTPVTVANLTMYPLLLLEESAPGYLTLDEALAAGLASVTEVSESGRVPELLVKNPSSSMSSMRKGLIAASRRQPDRKSAGEVRSLREPQRSALTARTEL